MKNTYSNLSKSVLALFVFVAFCFVTISSNAQFAEVKNTPFGFRVYHQMKNGSFVLLSDTTFEDESENKKPKISKEELVVVFVSINGGPQLKATYTGEMVKIKTSEGKFQVPSGIGTITGEGFEYSGSCFKGLMHGSGRFIYNKENYNGQFTNGKRNGTGEMIFSNGDEYKGNWTNDFIEGDGTMLYGVFYQGTKRMIKGSYDGKWVRGKKNGNGTFMWGNGDQYSGNWIDDKRSGTGELSFYKGRELVISEVGGLNAVKFTGEWFNDSAKGTGDLTYLESVTTEDKKRIQEAVNQGIPSNPLEISLTRKGPLTWNGFNVSGDVDVRFTNGSRFKGTLMDGKMVKGKLFFLLEKTNVEGQKIGTWENGKFTGKAQIPYSEKSSYIGDISIDKKQGKGKMIYVDGASYDGDWDNDIRNGKGKYTWSNGSYYDGDWKGGFYDGAGIMKLANGEVWKCNWKMNMPVDSGEVTLPSGGKYIGGIAGKVDGNLMRFFYQGLGKFFIKYPTQDTSMLNDSMYVGYYLDGKAHGNGKMVRHYLSEETDITKATYDGNWSLGKKQGLGKMEMEYVNGFDSYEGEWSNDLKNGKGKSFYSGEGSETNCIGNWKDDKMTGYGEEIRTNSNPMDGTTENYTYKGNFENDSKNGQGTEISPEGTYTGEWLDGQKHGIGKMLYKDGRIYEGKWGNGLPNGEGTMTLANKTFQKGSFAAGEFQKPVTFQQVTIGNQVWMSENLNVTRFRNGDDIPEVRSMEEWVQAGANGKPAFCKYNNDPLTVAQHGLLYNFFAVNDPRGLAPEGWKIPSHTQVEELRGYLSADIMALQDKIKEQKKDGINTSDLQSQLNSVFTTSQYFPSLTFNYLPDFNRGAKYFLSPTKSPNAKYYIRNNYGEFKDNDSESYYWTNSYIGDALGYVMDFDIYGKLNSEDVSLPQRGWLSDHWLVYGNSSLEKPCGLPVRCIKN